MDITTGMGATAKTVLHFVVPLATSLGNLSILIAKAYLLSVEMYFKEESNITFDYVDSVLYTCSKC